ncbi:dTDP-4-dehydrorhamnose reductase [Chitinolyticbacter albus]|uniref:dTDP-4-dehydrorhamnose reductase n=1 Tax=Chitinolyticbacter albus TaxID=2961951 RepID=UPI002109BC85|nr:dTDP-4-dehydrorhamnose reductase [Chitinolyticbacter albus]
MSPVFLITGADGQLGLELARALAPYGKVWALGRSECDLADASKLNATLENIRPDFVFNAAAFTAVDLAESQQVAAYRVNAAAPAEIADWAEKNNAILLHYSTDYVFDGKSTTPYLETSPTHALSIYGDSKLKGELAVLDRSAKAFVLRTSWMHSPHGHNFLKTMLRLMSDRESINVVADQYGIPTAASLVANLSALVVQRCLQKDDVEFGLYHVSSSGLSTWHEYARQILLLGKKYNLPLLCKADGVKAIPGSEYPLPAKRPAYSALNSAKFEKAFGVYMPPWLEEVEQTVRIIAEAHYEK